MKSLLLRFIASTSCLIVTSTLAAQSPAERHFTDKIVPLLRERCLECHNSNEQEGALDLSRKASAMKGGDSGAAIVPGKPDESLLWEMIAGDDMPQDRPPLSKEDKQVFRKWIEDGAAWPTESIARPERGSDSPFSADTTIAVEPAFCATTSSPDSIVAIDGSSLVQLSSYPETGFPSGPRGVASICIVSPCASVVESGSTSRVTASRFRSGEVEVRLSEHPKGRVRHATTRSTMGGVQVGGEVGRCRLGALSGICRRLFDWRSVKRIWNRGCGPRTRPHATPTTLLSLSGTSVAKLFGDFCRHARGDAIHMPGGCSRYHAP